MSNIVSLIVRLVDNIKPALPGLLASVDKLDKAIGKVAKPPPLPPALSATAATSRRLAPTMLAFGAAAAGVTAAAGRLGNALSASTRESARFEHILTGIGVTGDLTAAQLATLRARIMDTSQATGRMATDLGEAAAQLIAAGFAGDKVAEMISPIARVSVAADAAIANVTDMSKALFQSMNVMPDQLEAIYDKIVTATKAGNFELRGMAQHFSTVAKAANSAGMKSGEAAVELAAALQVVQAGGDESSAATNLTNILLKLQSPETTRKFKEAGVDIRKAIADGMKNGQSPLETIVLETRKALAKNKKLQISDLFQDMQVVLGLQPLLDRWEEVKKIIDDAGKASGSIARDFKTMSSDMQAAFDRLDASADRRRKAFSRLAEPFERLKAKIGTWMNNWLTSMAERFPRVSLGVVGFSSAAGSLSGVIGDLAPMLVGLASSLAVMKFAGLTKLFGVLLKGFGAVLRLLGGPLGWALLAGGLAWTFRSELMDAFRQAMTMDWGRLGERIAAGAGNAMRAAGPALRNVAAQLWSQLAAVDYVALARTIGRGLKAITTLPQRMMIAAVRAIDWTDVAATVVAGMLFVGYGIHKAWQKIGEVVREAASEVFDYLKNIDWQGIWDGAINALTGGDGVRKIGDTLATKLKEINLAAAGTAIMNSLLDGLKAGSEAVLKFAADFKKRVLEIFDSIGSLFGLMGGRGASPPAAKPISYNLGGLAPAPVRKTSVINNWSPTIHVNGNDPEAAARHILAALDRQRQAGLYDGALA